MPTLQFFSPPLEEETANQIADACPNGRAWAKKRVPDSNTYNLIRCLASSFNRVQQQIDVLAKEFNINLSVDLLPEWEASVSLPDECIKTFNSLEEQRNTIIARLSKTPIVTKAEFEALGQELSGETVVVTDGWTYDTANNYPNKYSRFKMYVQFINSSTGFPYSFPYPFGSFRFDIVECIFKKIKPANVVMILV